MGASLKSEVRKIFTTRMWWGLLLGMMVMAALLSLMYGSLVGNDAATGEGGTGNPFKKMVVGTAQLVYSAGAQSSLTTLIPLSMGVLLITNEFRHKTISSTFLATPNRWVVLITKMLAVIPLGIAYGVAHDIASAGAGAATIKSKGYPTLLDKPEVWQTFGLVVVAFVVWTLLGFGFGMLIRNQVAAVLTAVGFAFIVQIALNILFSAQNWDTAAKFLPSNLTSGMLVTSDPTAGQQVTSGGASPFFSWWASALILTGYALALSVIGSFLQSRRDIT